MKNEETLFNFFFYVNVIVLIVVIIIVIVVPAAHAAVSPSPVRSRPARSTRCLHTQERGLSPRSIRCSSRFGRLFDRLEEPADQSVDHQRPGSGADEEADDQKDREGPELPVDPVAGEHADQGRHQEAETDLREEGEISQPSAGLDHGRPVKAAEV